jgi:amino acid transporter
MAGETETQLERTLRLKEALMIGVGTMVGAGIFVLPGGAAALAGPASSAAFVIAVLTALSASELATAMPASGGPYHFINRGLGPLFGSIAGLGNWLGLAFATAFYAVGFGNYASPLAASLELNLGVVAALPLSGPQIGGLVAAGAFILVNYLSTDGTGALQNVIVIVLSGCSSRWARHRRTCGRFGPSSRRERVPSCRRPRSCSSRTWALHRWRRSPARSRTRARTSRVRWSGALCS